ncbi:MAG: hypothetical protein U0Z17_06620 [Bacteroidales bacterium]
MISAPERNHWYKTHERIDPAISDDIKRSAMYALFFALVAIFIYVAIRFRKWQYGLGGVTS